MIRRWSVDDSTRWLATLLLSYYCLCSLLVEGPYRSYHVLFFIAQEESTKCATTGTYVGTLAHFNMSGRAPVRSGMVQYRYWFVQPQRHIAPFSTGVVGENWLLISTSVQRAHLMSCQRVP